MKLLILIGVCAASTYAFPEATSSAPLGPVRDQYFWKKRLLNKWEKPSKKIKIIVESAFKDPSEPGPSRLPSESAIFEAIGPPDRVEWCQEESTNYKGLVTTNDLSESRVDYVHDTQMSQGSSRGKQCTNVKFIPEALSPEKKEQLRILGEQNERVDELRVEVNFEWSNNRHEETLQSSGERTQMNMPSPTQSLLNVREQDPDRIELIQLERRKAELVMELNRLKRLIAYERKHRLCQLGAGPCNGLPNVPNQNRISSELARAALETLSENYCNAADEIQEEIYKVIIAKHALMTKLRGLDLE